MRRPLVAALLNLCFLVGGLGYLVLGQRAKALRAFAVVLALELVYLVFANLDFRPGAMALGPLIFILQLLTALDAWLVARALRAGGAARDATAVALLLPLVGGSPLSPPAPGGAPPAR